ncbi:MAG: hypothetical protein ACTSPY_11555 [Candidatus Helarchaeota archaeon]
MSNEGENTNLSEEEKKRELEAKRKELEEQRKKVVASAEESESRGNISEAIKFYSIARSLSEELNEKDRVKIFEEKVKLLSKKEMEIKKQQELDRRKEEIEREREMAIEAGDAAVKEGRFEDAIKEYNKVIDLSKQINDKEVIGEYKAKVNEISSKKAELRRKFELQQQIKELEVKRRDILRKAEEAVAKENYRKAGDLYEEAAKVSEDMAQPERTAMFNARAEEMREIAKDIEKREEEERRRAELEKERIRLEDRRAKMLGKAERMLEKGLFKAAAEAYETAAKLSLDLGEKEVATGFTAQARDIREKEPQLRAEWRMEKKRKSIRKIRERLLNKADNYLESEEYLAAARIFIRSAELSKDAGEKDKAKEFQLKADECRTKEKHKRDELLDRVARAVRAVITLRLMEPQIASKVFSWGSDFTVVIKIWDIGSLTVNFREGEATITRGESVKTDMIIEGTSETLMKYFSGKYTHATIAKWFGSIRTRGPKKNIEMAETVFLLPPLQKDIEKKWSYSALVFLGSAILVSALMLIIFTPWKVGHYLKVDIIDYLINVVYSLGLQDISIGNVTLGWVLSIIGGLTEQFLVFLLYFTGALILILFVPYYSMKRYYFERSKKGKTKEKKRILRQETVKEAEKFYKQGKFIDASRLWQKAALISVELADEDRAAEYASRAYTLKGKTDELKKKWKIERKKELEERTRKELASQRDSLEKERKKVLELAQQAENEGHLLEASRHYKLASKLSLDIGDKEMARDFNEKSKEAKRREADLRRRRKAELERIKQSEKIDQLEGQLKESIEIAEVAITEERWEDAAQYYTLASKLAGEMGDPEKASAYKGKANEFRKKSELESSRANLEEQRRKAIIEAEAAMVDGDLPKAARFYMEAAKISQQLGEKDIAEGFKATAEDLKRQMS